MYTFGLKMIFIFIFAKGRFILSRTYQTRRQEAVALLFSKQREACLTAEDAYQALLESGMDVGKTTVYRAITRLCQTGVLRRYAPQESGEAARYQFNPCTESHLHIRCIHCGALAHLHCDEVEAFAKHLNLHHGFTLDEGHTILYGCCEACQSKPKRGNE